MFKKLGDKLRQKTRRPPSRETSPAPSSMAGSSTTIQLASTSINPEPDPPGESGRTPVQSHIPPPDVRVVPPDIKIVHASQGGSPSEDNPAQSTCSLPGQVASSRVHVDSVSESHVILAGADPIPRPVSAPPTVDPTSITGGWGCLKGFVQVLDKVSGGFGPLKAAMDGLVWCIDIYEGAATAREDYAELKTNLEGLFGVLNTHFSGNVPPTMTEGMNNLCSAIEKELDRISSKEERQAGLRYLETKKDINEVMSCYKRIHEHLERLRLNADLSMWKTVDELSSEIRLDRLAPSKSALYNSAEAAQVGRRECTPKTREEVLATLGSWRYDKSQGNIYWLNGMAGTGKTTIAKSLCVMLDRSHELGASFFCSRLLPECRNVKLILPTIAYQLARFSRPFYHALSLALQKDPDLHAKELPNQLQGLIIGPLLQVAHTLPLELVVVIDALDECEDDSGVSLILQLLAKSASNLPLKIFVSSRPEPQIRDKIGGTELQIILHELDRSIVKEDIRTYLRTELADMSLTDSELTTLVEDAGTLFIYAATAVRYITKATSGRRKRLQIVLGVVSSASSIRNKEIDALYSVVLSSAFNDPDLDDDEKKNMKLVLDTVICAQEPLTVSALAGLLQLDEIESVHAALEPLWSVLHISGADGLVATLHASFPDYMLDPNRSKEYGCKEAAHHGRLAELCFQRIENNKPQFNICGLQSSYLFDDQVSDLEERVKRMIPKEFTYACCYWAVHLQLGGLSSERMRLLDELVSKRLLLWMEVLNLKGQMNLGPVALAKAREWCKIGNGSRETQDLVHEAWRYVTMFATNALSHSTPHIYVSMLASWPRVGLLARCYLPRAQGLPEVGGSGMARRELAPLSVLLNDSQVESVAFSPDGMRIVSSCDKEVRVWDAQTGKPVLDPLEGHTQAAHSVAFSPNGMHIVSGSSDGTIRIWDARTGQPLLDPLIGHTAAVWSVAFSPDGSRIVSGSDDHTIRIWDPRPGQPVLHTLQGHAGSVVSVVFSPDGSRIISGSNDKTIRVWDVQSGTMVLGPLEGHTDSVWSVAISPDGTCIASASRDGAVRLWSSETGKPVLEPLEGHTDAVWFVAFSPDGMHLISGSADNMIRRWNTHTGQPVLGPLEGHTGLVYSVAFSLDGTRIVSGSEDKTIRVWDAQIVKQVSGPLEGHTKSVNSVAYSPDCRSIVSSSVDGTIRLWDGETGQPVLGPLRGHTAAVFMATFSPDGLHIVSASEDKTIRVWDAHTGIQVLDPLKGHSDSVCSVAFSPDSTHIVSGSTDNTVRMWDAQTGKPILESFDSHTDTVWSVSFSPDGMCIASGSADKTIRLWSSATGMPMLGPLEGHTGEVYSVAFSPNGTRIASGSEDETIRTWDTQTGQPILDPLRGHTAAVWSVVFSSDGLHIVSGSNDKTIQVWNSQTGQRVLQPFRGHVGSVVSIALSAVGSRIVSGSLDKTIRVWDAQTGKPILHPLEGHSSAVLSVAFSPDGMCIASGSDDGAICLWSSETGKALLDPLEGHDDVVQSVAFSPDGSRLVSGSADETIRIWDPQTGQAVGQPLKGHTEAVNRVAFSHDGLRIVSGSSDETMRVWDAQMGKQVLEPLKGHTGPVLSVAFSPDGIRIVSSSRDKTIRLWNAQTGQPALRPLEGHTDVVYSAAFSPDGMHIVSGSRDNTIRVWDAQTGSQILDPLVGHSNVVYSVAFSPDGMYILSGSYDGTIKLWDARTGATVIDPLEGHTQRVFSVAFSPDGKRIVSGSGDHTVRVWDICHSTAQSLPTPDPSSHPLPSAVLSGHRFPATQRTYNAFPQWWLDGHGCVFDKDRRLLLWIPPDLRSRLLTPQSPVLISTQGTIRLDFDQAVIGESWVSCFLPA